MRPTCPAPPLPQLPATVAAALLDPSTSDEHLLDLVDEHAVPDTYVALLHRPRPAHAALLAAARGASAGYELLYYAIKDAQPPTLQLALDLAAADPSTWEVVAPALADAPAATSSQLRTLASLLSSTPDDLELHRPTALDILARLNLDDATATAG